MVLPLGQEGAQPRPWWVSPHPCLRQGLAWGAGVPPVPGGASLPGPAEEARAGLSVRAGQPSRVWHTLLAPWQRWAWGWPLRMVSAKGDRCDSDP